MNIFDSILVKRPKRSLFNMSHEYKLTGNMGILYPIFCEEVVPGDTFKISSEILVRFAPMLAPIMHRVNVKINYHFVPTRLIWDEWEDFITGGVDGKLFPIKPYLSIPESQQADLFGVGSLADYLGFPSPAANGIGDMVHQFDALPFRAYSLIWNEWYRNQNVQDERPIGFGSGNDTETIKDISLAYRCWEKDYFTSALPFVQRGDPVKIPIDGGVVQINPKIGSTPATVNVDKIIGKVGGNEDTMELQSSGGSHKFLSPDDDSMFSNGEEVSLQGELNTIQAARSLEGDIKNVTATINDLRTAYRLQRWLENNARAGSRYIEQILSHFGVKSPDARLQRSEYLGGYSAPIVVSEVLQNTQEIDGSTPLGNMAGHGMALDKSHYVKRFFPEHGYIIGLLSVMPRTTYQQGLPRKYQRETRYDYYFPEFANLGEQDLKHNEVYYDFDVPSGDSTPFGYQQRFSEMRYIPSTVHGDFKSNLAFWHLGRIFDSMPEINDDFVSAKDIRDDVFPVSLDTVDKLWIEVYNNVRAVRPLPKYAIPTL